MTNKGKSADGFRVIAIDGGAASGKSSTAKAVCRRCGFLHVDTGSHYRAVALACLRGGVAPIDGAALREFVGTLSFSSAVSGNESLICFKNGFPPKAAELRSEEVNRTVSPLAAIPAVREAVKVYQRRQVDLAREKGFKGIVMDGRDIGTVILPDADLKIFLVADPSTRQNRRILEGAVDAIADRDKRDSTRATAPLRPADDAVIIDNSDLSLPAVVDRIIQLLDLT